MYVTLSKFNAKGYKQQKVDSLAEVAEIATIKPKQNWSCGIYKDDYRNLENFHCAYFIGLDFDAGMTLEEAKSAFREYRHCIVTSRSHQKEKHGLVADRFRVVLQLAEPIKDSRDFYATWNSLQQMFPAIDPACKDASRMWYTGNDIVAVKEDGILVQICRDFTPTHVAVEHIDNSGDYGKLSKLTNDFLEFGAPGGLWNHRLFKAAKDMQEQGYTLESAIAKLQRASLNFEGSLNDSDINTIGSAFKQSPKHSKRRGAFVWETVEELTDSEDILWLIDGLLSLGGLGILAGKPGLGKSTITRQLAKCICEGKPFLGRKVLKGAVLHVTLEETKQILKKEAVIQGLADEENYFLHTRSVNLIDNIGELEQAIVDKRAKLLIIDSLIRAAGDLDTNSQNEVNKFLIPLQDLAERADCSILLVHHQNKSGTGQDSVAGSFAIAAAGDMIMTFEGEGKNRWLNTTKLRGGSPWFNFRIVYDEVRRWYNESASRDDY